MTEAEAIAIQKFLEDYCAKNGLWCIVQHDKKPDLRFITFEVTIRVSPEEQIETVQ